MRVCQSEEYHSIRTTTIILLPITLYPQDILLYYLHNIICHYYTCTNVQTNLLMTPKFTPLVHLCERHQSHFQNTADNHHIKKGSIIFYHRGSSVITRLLSIISNPIALMVSSEVGDPRSSIFCASSSLFFGLSC